MIEEEKNEGKKSFILYTDYSQYFEILSFEDRGKLITSIFDYTSTGIEPSQEGAIGMAFKFIQSILDRDAAKWEAKKKARSEAGKKGGIASGKSRQPKE